MLSFVNNVLTAILACIAGIHLYWAFGGDWGIRSAIPTTADGELLLVPSFIACLFIALIFTGILLLVRFSDQPIIPRPVARTLLVLTAIAFLLRAIGDFNYVGVFKKVEGTKFALFDSAYYTPLCFFLFVLLLYKILQQTRM